MSRKLRLTWWISCLSFFAVSQVAAQSVSGTVTSDEGEPLIGVSVIVKNTTRGVSTGLDGTYNISLQDEDEVLIFSFIGFASKEIAINGQTTIDVNLEIDLTALDEIVVVGYGTQRVKDLTSAISTIKSDEIVKSPVGQTMQALQGKVAGVQIVNNGAPGDEPTVRIRGIGSHPSGSDASPLYVVDGAFFNNIDFLNTSDIESVSVLKDASASAIYGVRAANGVVLITTKGGNLNSKPTITYDGYYGVQVPMNVIKMANAEQYVNYVNQTGSVADIELIDNAMQRFGRSRINPNVPDVSSDWYAEIMRDYAEITNHSLSIYGGNAKTSYSVGVSYFNQNGLLKAKNSYERLNIRTKIDQNAFSWLKVGGHLNISNGIKQTASNAAWWKAYHAVPILPVFDDQNTEADPLALSNAKILGYRGSQNPFVDLEFTDNRLDIRKILSGIYTEAELFPDLLTFRSSYNVSMEFLKQREVFLPYVLGAETQRETSSLNSSRTTSVNHYLDNTLTLQKQFNDHDFNFMLGSSYRDEWYDFLTASASDIPIQENSWYIGQTLDSESFTANDNAERVYGLSYLGRLSYRFQNKYLAYVTLRREGTSKYQKKWGTFPAVGLGWVVSEENFLSGVSFIDFLKVRAGWGKLGNDAIQRQDGANTTNPVDLAINDQLITGTETTNSFGYLEWEVVSEKNIGISAEFLKNRLTLEADYFIRDTENAAIPVQLLLQSGSVLKNVGSFRNSGMELTVGWSSKLIGKLQYTVSANLATLNNEVTDLFGQEYLDAGSAEFRQRYIVGEAVASFFGFERAGVYQTQEEIDADPIAVEEGLVPGDLKFVDQDNDGDIDGDDRVVLGSYIPDLTYGGNIGLKYGNFEFSAYIMGQTGNKILNRKRGELIFTQDTNVDADLATGVWNGPGTSDSYPSAAGLRRGWNQQLSDYLIEDGSFFRVQNLQLAYNLNGKEIFGHQFPNARIYITAERPITIFDYNGFNPEVANGVDRQVYPIPAVYTMGVNLKL